jgi:uncharacterized repeat protein (TIGR01451 family)
MVAFAVVPAVAAGSGNLWPNPPAGSRANTEWRTSSYGGGLLLRRTLLKAFMNSGEVVMLGSSAVGQGAADILVYNPGLVTGPVGGETVPVPASASFSCDTQRLALGAPANQGMLTTRAQELAGPDTIPTGGVAGGYVPCHYQAPVTGVYDIAFLGPAGFAPPDADGNIGADIALALPQDTNALQGTSVAAWDATVRANLTATTNLTGRIFSYYLALFTGGNGLPVFPTIYPVTRDGYRYRVQLRGMDPNGWLVYGNQLGFLDSDGATPLYHDAVAVNSGSPGQLTSIQGGVTFARPAYPLFFEPPDPATIAALGIPVAPTAPIMTSLSFAGTLGGNTSLINNGGTFTFTSNVPGVYNLVISRNGVNFDPTLPGNRSLRGVRPAGVQTVPWDGKDNSGAFFPVGTYPVHASFHGGEYHFPMIDVENNTQGGPIITLLNPPGGTCPPLIGGCTSGFYDDRAYQTLNGTVVDSGNTVGNPLCGISPPATTFSDPINGYDTTTAQRAYGTGIDGNTNVPCTGNFGDTKGMDIWTFYPSNSVLTPVNIVAAAADIGVTKIVSNATPAVGTNVTFTIVATNLGPSDATGVQVTDVLPGSLTFVSSIATLGAYNQLTGIWNIGNLAAGASATLQITVTVTTTNTVTNTATRTASSPIDVDPANDSASAQVTGSTVPGLPNNGVPAAASAIPTSPPGGALAGLLPLLLILAAAGAAIRRRA